MKIKPATEQDRKGIEIAIQHLRVTRVWLRDAGAAKAAKAVSRALKSAEGALRHVERRIAAPEPKDWRAAYPVGDAVEVKVQGVWMLGCVTSHYSSGEGPAIAVNTPHRVEYFSPPIKHLVRKAKT